MKNYAKLLFVFALAFVALACISTPAMAEDCDNPTVDCSGGHQPVIVIVCGNCPPDITCNGSGCSASYAVVDADATDPKSRVGVPLEVILRLTGRI